MQIVDSLFIELDDSLFFSFLTGFSLHNQDETEIMILFQLFLLFIDTPRLGLHQEVTKELWS